MGGNTNVQAGKKVTEELGTYLSRRVPEVLSHLVKNSNANGFSSLEILKQIMAIAYVEEQNSRMKLVLGAVDSKRAQCTFTIDLETMSVDKRMVQCNLFDGKNPLAWVWLAPSNIVDLLDLKGVAGDCVMQALACDFPQKGIAAELRMANTQVTNEFSRENANFSMVMYLFHEERQF